MQTIARKQAAEPSANISKKHEVKPKAAAPTEPPFIPKRRPGPNRCAIARPTARQPERAERACWGSRCPRCAAPSPGEQLGARKQIPSHHSNSPTHSHHGPSRHHQLHRCITTRSLPIRPNAPTHCKVNVRRCASSVAMQLAVSFLSLPPFPPHLSACRWLALRTRNEGVHLVRPRAPARQTAATPATSDL